MNTTRIIAKHKTTKRRRNTRPQQLGKLKNLKIRRKTKPQQL
jgi:hypothetical protein